MNQFRGKSEFLADYCPKKQEVFSIIFLGTYISWYLHFLSNINRPITSWDSRDQKKMTFAYFDLPLH